jgi:predicted secreted protein
MKSTWLIKGIVVTALLVTTACSSLVKEISVNETSSGKQVEILENGSITITLDSNITTGYSWQLTGISDAEVLEKVDNPYESPTNGLLGAGSKEILNLKALKAGTTTLSIVYF